MNSRRRTTIPIIILSILFAIFTLLGYSYSKNGNWDLIYNNNIQIFKTLVVAIVLTIFFNIIVNYVLYRILPKMKYKESKNKVINFIFKEHSFIMPLIIILILWLPYIIVFYPGILTPDAGTQLVQYYGLMDEEEINFRYSVNLIDENVRITNHHPVFYTAIIGKCIDLGKILGSDNFGIFIYTTMQVLLLSTTLALCIDFMKKNKTSNILQLISLIVFSVLPIFPLYAITITKDVPFTCLIILYTMQIYELIQSSNNNTISLKKILGISILGILMSLIRNNGIYIILLSLPFLAIIDKINRKKIITIVAIIFITYESYTHVVLPMLKIPNSSIKEMLSVPFQQTARYVKEYNSDVTEEEKQTIDRVLNYNMLSELYTPEKSDKVKNTFNKDCTKEDLKHYFIVWVKQLLKHPDSYIQAYLNNYYGYFYINYEIQDYIYGASPNINTNPRIIEMGKVNYSYIDRLINIREAIIKIAEKTRIIPILSIPSNIALSSWSILIILVYMICNKKYKYIIAILPSCLILLICIVSPVNGYFRYAMPNVFAMLLIISIFLKTKEVENL